MKTFELEKLVRDEIFQSMLELGQVPDHRVLEDDTEYGAELERKLSEEVTEYLEADEADKPSELINVVEVVRQLARLRGQERTSAYLEAGVGLPCSFDGRHYVKTITLPENKKNATWIAYFEAHPDRFPAVED